MVPPMPRRYLVRALGGRVDVERVLGLSRLVAHAGVVVVNETHMTSSAQVCELRRARPNMRVVTVCYENIPFRYEDVDSLHRRKDLVRRLTDCFVALTPEARAALVEEGVDSARVVVQPYGVDVSRFGAQHRSAGIRRRWGADTDDVVVLFTGRLLREKGLTELVRAVGRLHDPRIRLVMVGSGPEARRLDLAAASMRVPLLRESWVDQSEIPAILASADVFALPSLPTPYWEEQLGFSAIEAMATGLPVVGVASGSIPFVVGQGGVLAAPYDVPGLARALSSLVASPSARESIGATARRRAAEVLNTEVVAERLRSLLTDIGATRLNES